MNPFARAFVAVALVACGREASSRADVDASVIVTATPPPPAESAAPPPASTQIVPPQWLAQAPAGHAVHRVGLDLLRAVEANPASKGRSFVLSPLALAGALANVPRGHDEIVQFLRVAPDPTIEKATRRAERVYRSRATKTDLPNATPISFDSPERARAEINAWIQRESKGAAPLPTGTFDATARVLVVTAIATTPSFEPKFAASATRPTPFKALDGRTIEVPMMRTSATLRTAGTSTYDAVEIPCVDGDHALLVVAPKAGKVEGIAASFGGSFDAVVAALRPESIHLEIPRFRVATARSYRAELEALGVRRAFDEIDAFVNAAAIDVDEHGAKSSSTVPLSLLARTLRFDRPFYFWLRNVHTETPIVIGRYVGD